MTDMPESEQAPEGLQADSGPDEVLKPQSGGSSRGESRVEEVEGSDASRAGGLQVEREVREAIASLSLDLLPFIEMARKATGHTNANVVLDKWIVVRQAVERAALASPPGVAPTTTKENTDVPDQENDGRDRRGEEPGSTSGGGGLEVSGDDLRAGGRGDDSLADGREPRRESDGRLTPGVAPVEKRPIPPRCPVLIGSVGCDLPAGHPGVHRPTIPPEKASAGPQVNPAIAGTSDEAGSVGAPDTRAYEIRDLVEVQLCELVHHAKSYGRHNRPSPSPYSLKQTGVHNDGMTLAWDEIMRLAALPTGEHERWWPIESAPKNGTTVLLSGVGLTQRWVGTGHWFKGFWLDDGPGTLSNVDYWRPTPSVAEIEQSKPPTPCEISGCLDHMDRLDDPFEQSEPKGGDDG